MKPRDLRGLAVRREGREIDIVEGRMQGKFPKGEFAKRVIDNPHDALTGLGQTNRSTGGYDGIGNRWKNVEICPDSVHVPARVPPNALASSFMGHLKGKHSR